MNLSPNLDICQGITELKLKSLATISNSISYFSNMKMTIIPTLGALKNLY